jgi:hypothetical protein
MFNRCTKFASIKLFMHSKKNRKKNAKQLKIKSNEMKDIYIYIYSIFYLLYLEKENQNKNEKHTNAPNVM